MQTSETRIVNQCTYTPIEVQEGDSPPQQPFAKQSMLAAAFADYALSKVVLKRMEDKDILPDPRSYFEDLASAVVAMWEGDLASSIAVLREADMDQVADFARTALEVERKILEQARLDLNDAVASAVKRAETEAERVSELHREMAAMRESILADVRATAVPSPIGSTSVASAEAGGVERIIRAAPPEAVTSQVARTMPEIASAQSAVTLQMIQDELAVRAPLSASFLQDMQFFATPQALWSAPVSTQWLAVQLELTAQKTQTVETLLKNTKVEPVGYLHLERLQFTPLGYDRGELVYSLPLLPKETVRLSHREWSRTETEYTKLVATQLETATEEALSEKSEITQSSSTQQQHSSAFNTSVNASGGYGSFHISTSFGYSSSNSESQSRQSSSKRAQEITKKATSRAKQEHKVTFKIATAYELEDQQYREITNPLDRAVRYDFHRLMKKWRIDLYRYDVRLTYDIVIPEPGSYLLRKYILLKAIDEELTKPNPFNISPASISRVKYISGVSSGPSPSGHYRAPEAILVDTYWETLSQKYGVSLNPPPDEYIFRSFTGEVIYSKQEIGSGYIDISLPDGYEFFSCTGGLALGDQKTLYNNDGSVKGTIILGAPDVEQKKNFERLEYRGLKHSNHFSWLYTYRWWLRAGYQPNEGDTISFHVDVQGKLTERAFAEWQTECYERLADAAKLQHESRQQRLKQMRDALLEELNREDALMLRKLEREELMKGVLRWLLGPKFKFYPQNQAGLQLPDLPLEQYDPADVDPSLLEDVAWKYYDSSTQSVVTKYWQSNLHYGELIKFLHQAIEWENVNYVLYPYFWTQPNKERWDFKQSLYHSDYVHRSFLRAGAARVVLTIRPGFEKDFLSLIEGQLEGLLPDTDRYMTIADELEATARTNYPYTQDANAEKEEYVFTWEYVPHTAAGNEEGRLKRYLRQAFYIDWAEEDDAEISKSDDENTIRLSIYREPDEDKPKQPKLEGSVEIKLDEPKNTATLSVTGSKSYDLKVKVENSLHKVYREQNLVDTWYEYTPTGALDVVEGDVLA